MTTPQSQRVAIVIGGASGVGEAIVERFARDEWSVIVADSDRNERLAQQVADNVRATGREVSAETVDVADEGEVAALIEATVEFQGSLDAIIHSGEADPLHLASLLKYGTSEIDNAGGGVIVLLSDTPAVAALAKQHTTPEVRVHCLSPTTFRVLDEVARLVSA